MLLTIVAFIVIFSALVLVHEWGHFAAARRAKITVEEFGIGLPPRAKSLHKDKQGTIYSLNWIPFGGFVRLFGEDSSDPKILKDKRSFASKTIWQRTQVIVAGVVMNFVLAWLLITIGFIFGMQPFLATAEDVQAGIQNGSIEASPAFYVHGILEDSPLANSDLKPGDFIVAVNEGLVSDDMVLSEVIQPDTEVLIQYIRDGVENQLSVVSDNEGKVGISISLEQRITSIKDVKYPFYIAPFRALSEVGRLSVLTVKMLGGVVSSLVGKLAVPEGVAGPVGIFKLTGQYAEQGLIALVQFTALLSISLGVINIMPFPALDGGRFLFIIFELIARRKPNAKWEAIIHSVGFALLMLLILIITWNDIVNLMSS